MLPPGARAQQIERRVGALLAYQESDAAGRVWVKAFRDGLAHFGWTEGRNIQLDLRWATPDLNIIEQNAKALVAANPEVILSSSTPTTAALKQQTRTIPVVFANVVDPVGSGFVASLSRPGGNVTGFVNLEASIAGKWLGLLKEVAPHVARVAVLFHPPTAPYAHIYLDVFKSSADAFKVEIASVSVPDSGSLETLIASQAREANTGLILVPSVFMAVHMRDIVEMATRHRLPLVSFSRDYAANGGLLSYGNDIADNYSRAASYVDRILKGEKPSDLPVQFPIKFELVVNLRAARTLGLDVPLQFQQRADEVIE